jgi:hypothetical protein
MREVRRHRDHLTVYEEFPDGTCRGRYFTRNADGEWQPELPDDVEVPVERSVAGSPRGTIERIGGATGFGSVRTKKRAPTRARPERSYRDVELRLRGYVDYEVKLGSTARETIIDEIKRAHRVGGPATETGGFLFGQWRPSADGNFTVVSHALGPWPGGRTGQRRCCSATRSMRSQ